ncbi:MAG: AAA family ATPase [Caulobacterales bacterium]|nr:AAA family ATPase [Caulobacterales bacterium]MCA0371281.1 ATP-binding protein [Pseudomonadota bacterium]
MSKIINGLSLRNYRGIGDLKQTITGLKKFNFFIGKNNSGKSTILNFLSSLCPSFFNNAFMQYHPIELDFHRGDLGQKIEYDLIFDKSFFAKFISDAVTRNAIDSFPQEISQFERENISAAASKIQQLFSPETELVFSRTINGKMQNGNITLEETSRKSWLNLDELKEMLLDETLLVEAKRAFTQSRFEFMSQQSAPKYSEIHAKIESLLTYSPIKCIIIPAIREIRTANQTDTKCDGTNLFKLILELSNPRQEKRTNRTKFKKIEKFLATLIEEENVELIVAHDASEIQVSINGEPLPLTNLGTGIQELVIIATYCTLNEDCIVCIEEPEIHLHSTLQRKLIKYLEEKTNNQYFVATHSTTIIDCLEAEKSAVFHVTKSDEQTFIKSSDLTNEKIEMCRDLGYKASDLFQTNFIIWVEGPSDRIYLLKWLGQINAELKEGIHFSILFYGGRILSHFSADTNTEELIKLHPLNSNMAVFIDSDKTSDVDEINETKKRIKNEFSKDGSFCWITEGRETENYLEKATLKAAIEKVHEAQFLSHNNMEQFDNCLKFTNKKNEQFLSAKKVEIAKYICNQSDKNGNEIPLSLEILDLKERLKELTNKIQIANS